MELPAGITLRALTPQDGAALAGLSFSSSDEGFIQYAANYQIDAYQAIQAIQGDVAGVAAFHRDRRLVGIGLVRFGRCRFEGAELPFALLGNLIVHPDYRLRGLATRLADWRIRLAHERFGQEVVLLANFQHGNLASRRLVKKWARHIVGPLVYLSMKTVSKRPPLSPGIAYQAIEEDRYAEFAQGLAEFYQGCNFFQPVTAADLRHLCQATPLEVPIRRLYIALGPDGSLVAGLAAFEEFRLKQMEIRHLSQPLRLVNSFLQMVPQDGAVRQVYLDRIWFREGYARAGRCLVEHMRWLWHGKISNLSTFFDPRGPLNEIFSIPPWKMSTRSDLAVAAPGNLDPYRPVCPIY